MRSSNVLNNGANTKLAPLISFDTIVDVDFGLINLIYTNYLDKSVFDVNFFLDNTKNIIAKLYLRKDINPLYTIAKNDIDKQRLDDYYNEFLFSKKSDIYDMSITTEILNMIQTFNKSQEIIPTILCYNEDQIRALEEEDDLINNQKVLLSSLTRKDKESFSQFFFKDISEVTPFLDLKFKKFYLSTYGPNFGEDDLRDPELVKQIIKNGNKISIFDMYKKDITERLERN